MRTGTIYIADNGLEFREPKMAAMADYDQAIISMLRKMEIEYKDATGHVVSFTQYDTMITVFRAYMFNERRNRKTLRAAWRRCMADVAKYQRDSEA